MPTDESSRPKTDRRTFLTTSGILGVTGLLAGCNTQTGQATTPQTEGGGGAFEDVGRDWLTFGEENDWGMRYNQSTNELEVVHKPFGKASRQNIRIEADENDDKGDIYIDDSVIVKNEVEVSDGGPADPSYTFTNQNDVGLWLEDDGVLGVTTATEPAALFDNGTTRVAGDVTTTGNSPTTVWDSDAGHTPQLPAESVTKSGDGSSTTFALPNPLSTAPRVATVTPTSEDAAGSFWVSEKSESSVEITYSSPPPSGTDNLSFDLVVSL